LHVHIDTSAPSDWWFIYESIVQALAKHAQAGKVEGMIEGGDEPETFAAGPPRWATSA
jgi:hypothetical protein